jgi:hypothetical protein
MMGSSRMITLFTAAPPSRRGPSGFLVSMLVHVAAIALAYFGLLHRVRVADESSAQRYTVRLLNLEQPPMPPPSPEEAGRASIEAPGVSQAAGNPGGAPSAPAFPLRVKQTIPAPQTIVQPDLPPNLLLPKKTPVPTVLLWSQEETPARRIVPPEQTATVSVVRPSLEAPNREIHVADLKLAASAFPTEALELPPSTTAPVVVQGPVADRTPATASKAAGPPAPARVMALSDLQLQHGPVALPLVNETARSGYSNLLGIGSLEKATAMGRGNPAVSQNGSGAGQDSGVRRGATQGTAAPGGNGAPAAAPNVARGAGPGGGANPASGAGSLPQPESSPVSDSGSSQGLSGEPLVAHIVQPKDGHFGVVVVGQSIADEYPETVGLWGGRLAYTVYLHVGLAKNWILQYSLPRDAPASIAGEAIRPDAPWPYMMERPNLAPEDFDADALMVHGLVNTAGRFEQLSLVFPTEFSQTKFLLSALQQWQFRPAIQNGRLVAVEVLLIIPDEE